jgi:hypothetical protein
MGARGLPKQGLPAGGRMDVVDLLGRHGRVHLMFLSRLGGLVECGGERDEDRAFL